jgi:high-affinity iron transporter
MMAYRTLIQQGQPPVQVKAQEQRLQELLSEAGERLENTNLSPTMSFTGGLVILLREGLEAILVLAAIAAFLIKTGRRDVLPYLHVGWISALLLGGVTWVIATYTIDISGANREVTEGVTALLAAAILFYVGLWLHNRVHAQHWQRFIQSKVRNALNGRTLWALALVSFIAVYREVFETVLFYQALWVQAGPAGQHLVVFGFVVAVVMLLALAWLIFRFSVHLPLRLFFSANAALLYVLAFVFLGNGIAALQEAGQLPVNPVNFPEIGLLGIHPNLEVLGLQGLLILFTLLWTFRDTLGLRRQP